MQIIRKNRLKYKLHFEPWEIEVIEAYRDKLSLDVNADLSEVLAAMFQLQVDFIVENLQLVDNVNVEVQKSIMPPISRN